MHLLQTVLQHRAVNLVEEVELSDAIAELPVSAAGRTAMLREIQPRITALARQTLWGLHHRRHEGRVTDLWFDSLHEPAAEGERRWGE